MKQRIVIEKLNDGHVIVDKQQLSNAAISGNAHQRKLAKAALENGEVVREWRSVDRTVFRSGKVEALPSFSPVTADDAGNKHGVEILPLGFLNFDAEKNQLVAAEGVDFARQMVWAIKKQADSFTVSKPKRVVVTIEEFEEVSLVNR
jgi:hypothetical protein